MSGLDHARDRDRDCARVHTRTLRRPRMEAESFNEI